MSTYNSTNTKVLETLAQGKNLRMLLFHECGDGRYEYVIGSYFQQDEVPDAEYDEVDEVWIQTSRIDYSWDWGHYFGDMVSAVDYWKREVLGIDCHKPERFICPDCSGVYQEHPVELDYSGGWWKCPECGCSTCAPEEDLCIRIDY